MLPHELWWTGIKPCHHILKHHTMPGSVYFLYVIVYPEPGGVIPDFEISKKQAGLVGLSFGSVVSTLYGYLCQE